MSDELKPCPACDGPAVTAFTQANETACRNLDCPMASAWFTREAWNAMPRQSDIDTAVKKAREDGWTDGWKRGRRSLLLNATDEEIAEMRKDARREP